MTNGTYVREQYCNNMHIYILNIFNATYCFNENVLKLL